MTIPALELPVTTNLSLKTIENTIIEKQKKAFEKIRKTLTAINLTLLKNHELSSWYLERLRSAPERIPLAESRVGAYRRDFMSIILVSHSQDDAQRLSIRLSKALDSNMIESCVAMDKCIQANEADNVEEHRWAKLLINHVLPVSPIFTDDLSFKPDSYWLVCMCESIQDEDSAKRVLTDCMNQQIQKDKDRY